MPPTVEEPTGYLDDTTGLPAGATRARTVAIDLTRASLSSSSDAADHDVTAAGVSFDATVGGSGDDATMDFGTTAPQPPEPPEPTAPTGPQVGPLAVGQKFGPRYQIFRLLGIGGMGAVYQAWDAELDVVVALKVIRPEASIDPQELRAIERRFKQELLLARQVTHKNVVRIHDMGEIDGIKYITMSYIDGSDLATLLKELGKLPVTTALKITRQIAAGLLAAHEAGVVHRDLKPANIMIEGDAAIIMDFGIARSSAGVTAPVRRSASGKHLTAAQHTMAGAIVGTIAYMAPEQARGEPVDQRADIYALGLIMSDMLLGRRVRGSQESAVQELQRRMTEPPPLLRAIDPSVPEALERIVARCVQPDPAARFQTTADLVAALDALDQDGKPLPLVRRLTPRMMAAAAVVVLALLTGTYYGTRRALEPVKQPDPVTVVIADFDNRTNDAAFDKTLEPMLRRALEGAGFISAYDRTRISGTFGVRPPEKLDETHAREIAVRQGLGVVLAGSISPSGSGYSLMIKAVHTVTGNVITTVTGRASTKDDVLRTATRLIANVRTALGDATSESDQIFALTSLSVTSLDVVRMYAAGMEASSNNRYEDARQHFAKAIEVDPKFGIGYSSLAAASRNLGRVQDAEKYTQLALQHLDGMTDREKLSTRGFYYRITGDYAQCVKEYGELVQRFAADIVGRNQRALCMSKLRDMRGAMEEMRHVVALLPNRAIFRDNLALYANYAGEFETAEKEAMTVGESDMYALLALAFSQVGRGQLQQAVATYGKVQAMGARGASLAAAGLGDVAAVQGRYADAIALLEEGAAHDLEAKSSDAAATKLMAAAHVELLRGRKREAIALADRALASSRIVKIRFLAARTWIEAGVPDRAVALAQELARDIQAEPQAYAKLLEGGIALSKGNAREAITLFDEANKRLDTWIGHFDLGRAYLEAGAHIQADSELDRCVKRRGEALSLFADEDPTFAYFPAVHYLQGRVREGLKSASAADSYKTYLSFRGDSKDDVIAAELRRRDAR